MSRPRLAFILAFVALAAAVLGAIGPAGHVRTTYSWPPRTLPTGSPKSLWYTPLLLIRRQPEAISVRLPCSLPTALPGAERPVVVLATARFSEPNDGLLVARAGDELVVQVGDIVLARVTPSLVPNADEECAYRLSIGDGRWSLEGGPEQVGLGGDLETMPFVNGVFSALDLRSGTPPSIDLRTGVHASRTTARATIAWTIAAFCAIAALLLVAVERRPSRWQAVGTSVIRSAAARARLPDAVVAVALLGWWVIAPAFFDDGWVVARQSMFSSSGGFSNYYDSFGTNHPLGYWLEWAQHWLTEATDAMLILRVPALLCLAATWLVCRWILARILASSVAGDSVALWALASAFLVGAFAWGMTLRPEPELTLLATGVIACTVRFLERETAAPLAVAAVLVVLAVSEHPAGIVSIAPLIVALPGLIRWARARLAVVASIVTAAIALLLVLAFVGSDFEQRRADAQAIRLYGNAAASWREEINRYADLFVAYYGTPLRRESVALMVLAVLAYLVRPRRERRFLLDLPAAGLAVALLLLIATPSKWPWHFGTLLGVGAVAVATETARIRDETRRSRGWSPRPFIVVGAAVVAAAWSWSPRHIWSDLDLRTLEWTLGIESSAVNLSKLFALAPLALLAGAGLVALARGGRERLREVPWRVASWTATTLAVPLLAFTVAVLVADAAKTNAWTLARQNLKSLVGDPRCGLANNSFVAAPASMRALPTIASDGVVSQSDSLPAAPAPGLSRFTLGPPPARSVPARSPWFSVPRREPFGFFLGGIPGPSDTLELEWGRAAAGPVEILDADEISADFQSDAEPALVPWRFFAAGSLPSPPREANAVRLLLYSDVAPGSIVALTPPVTYRNRRLAEVLESGGPPLVIPNLVMYVPCARQPRLSSGVAEVPGLILGLRHSIWPIATGTSPFDGVPELYQLTRLPLTDSDEPPEDVVVYRVDQRIPGAVKAPPDAATIIS